MTRFCKTSTRSVAGKKRGDNASAATKITSIASCKYAARRGSSIPRLCYFQTLRANCARFFGDFKKRTTRSTRHLNAGRLLTMRNTQAVKNYSRSVRTIEGIEMNSGYIVIQKIVALL